MIWKCWNILLCFSKWKILTLTFGLIRASAFLYYNFLETFYFFSSFFFFLPFLFFIFNSFPSLSLLSPFLSSLFSPCSFCSFLTTGLCSVFHSDLKHYAEKLVQSITRHFSKPLDFLLKSPSQVWSELSPSYKIWEDHILHWYDSNHETSILICKSHSALLSLIHHRLRFCTVPLNSTSVLLLHQRNMIRCCVSKSRGKGMQFDKWIYVCPSLRKSKSKNAVSKRQSDCAFVILTKKKVWPSCLAV